MPADNSIYNSKDAQWWDENNFLHVLNTGINPARFGYFKSIIQNAGLEPSTLTVLDIGCGGGFLSEKFAAMGSRTIGLDISPASINLAAAHANLNRLPVEYMVGSAMSLPFHHNKFDIVVCCDVLEHVDGLEKAICESSRVLKPGGYYFFDTINRTLQSFLETIFVGQVLPITSFFSPGSHDWKQFITTLELDRACQRHKVEVKSLVGLQPGISKIRTALEIFKLKLGYQTHAEFGRRLSFGKSPSISGSYMGYAIKLDETK